MPKGKQGFQKGHKINLGKKYSKTRRDNISKALTGRKISEEWRKKLSKSHIGNRHTEETKKKISEGMKGKSTTWLTGRKLSEYQRTKLIESHTGKKHWDWKGGITPENRKIRRSLEYKKWRDAVFKRDNYTCQECQSRGCTVHADHIKPFAYFPELRFELSNGRTLCVPCHHKTPTWGRQKKCKTQQ